MRNANGISMDKQKENKEQELNELEKFARAHITVGERLPYRDDDPVLVRKLAEAYKTFEEAPIPDFLLKRMEEKD
jgi:hypothetical protein